MHCKQRQQTCIEGVQDKAQLFNKSYSLRIVQKNKFRKFYQMLYSQTSICPRKLDVYNFTTGHLIPARQPDLVLINRKKKKKKKRRTCCLDFIIPADHRVKIKESEKIDKYLDLAWELKTAEYTGDSDTNNNWCVWNGLQRIEKGIGMVGDRRKNRDYSDYSIDKLENWEESWRRGKTCCHLDFSEKPTVKTGVKNSPGKKKQKKNKRINILEIHLVLWTHGWETDTDKPQLTLCLSY